MNANKEQIIALLAQGISPTQVAAACGVSDSYVSQLRADPEIAAAVAASTVVKTEADLKFDSTLAHAETLALEKVEKSLPFANMGQALAAFRVLNTARRRADALTSQVDLSTSITVNLTLPAAAAAKYILNSANELIEVDGQTMITATAKSLDAILAARATSSQQVPADVALTRAANILTTVTGASTLMPRAPRRLPVALSADLL